MNTGLIASRYAKAFYDYAKSNQLDKQFYTEAKTLSKHLAAFQKLKIMLENPVVTHAEKLKYLQLAAGGNVTPVFDKFMTFVLKKGRVGILQTIMLKYVDLYREMNNIFYAKITTAHELDVVVEKRLVALVEQYMKADFEIEKDIDADIVGGFLLEFDHTRWDASIQRQLQNIKRELVL